MWSEFKKFAMKGNVLDLAVGVIIGGAFGKIVSSLVDDIIMPIVGMLIGGINFSSIVIANLKVGTFIQNVVDFFIVAFSIFIFIRFLNRFKKKEEAAGSPVVDKKEELLVEIRNLLKENQQLMNRSEEKVNDIE